VSSDLSRIEHLRRDFAALATACQARSTEYFILIEDDVIASRDWFKRLQGALSLLEPRASQTNEDWLYLRLFYSEIYLGWNIGEIPVYAWNIIRVYAAFLIVFLAPQLLSHRFSIHIQRRIRAWRLLQASVLLLWLPIFIILYFMAGRLLVNPYPRGVQLMPQYGCCSQGLVFPARHVTKLKQNLLEPSFDLPVDSIIEKIADDETMKKWALIPSAFQHVGVRGSSAEGGMRKSTWSFGFEEYTT